MQLVVRAVFASTDKLAATLSLALIVLYTLAVIGEQSFGGQYTFPDGGAEGCDPGNVRGATLRCVTHMSWVTAVGG